jgi:Cu(I)/Ag(I) efflux system membrane fusion protein
MKKKMNLWPMVIVLLLFLSFAGGIFWGRRADGKQEKTGKEQEVAGKATLWTCSMHPQIRLPKPGKCPICQMDLIPLKKTVEEEGPATLSMTEGAKKLAAIETLQVVRKFVMKKIRMVGKVAYNERKVNTLSAWIPGRIDALYVDYTGVKVAAHDHLALLYSPELLAAQQELLEAKRRLKEAAPERSQFLENSNRRTYNSTREKLRLWGLTEKQILDIEKNGKTSDKMTIYAPQGGVVVMKHVSEGDYVKTGSKLFTIADLSELWLLMDAYESDLPYLYYAQKVEITTEAYPGEVFRGKISFIHPELDDRSRTVKLRVNVENPDFKLKPGMFVRAIVSAKLDAKGRVVRPSLAGQWICPMHPEVIKGQAGACDLCGMDLVPAEKMDHGTNKKQEEPVVVPVTAVLKTGKRAVVYVEIKGKDLPTFAGREIVLGPRSEDYYIVLSGLKPGEWVVTNGNFKIDSALQIQAKPSMMNSVQDESKDLSEKNKKHLRRQLNIYSNSKIKSQLEGIYSNYFKMHDLLSRDDMEPSKNSLNQLLKATQSVELSVFSGDAKALWQEISLSLVASIHRGHRANNLKELRKIFSEISNQVIEIENYFGHSGGKKFYKIKCPMAFSGKGAYWLQDSKKIENPYYGKSMLKCGVPQKSEKTTISSKKNNSLKKHEGSGSMESSGSHR